jgi:PST family polysaccharide transporter
MTIVGQIMGLITAATTPILFSSLSRLQDDESAFNELFFKFQRLVGLCVIPIGVGMLCYSDLLTDILLGEQWLQTAPFIGLWGLTSAVTIVLSHYSSEVYRSKGRPKLSVLAQFLHLIVLAPAVYISIQHGFETLYVTRSLVRLELILVNLLIMYLVIKISPWQMLKNISYPLIASVIMGIVAFLLKTLSPSLLWQIASIVICACIYFAIVMINADNRKSLYSLISRK